MPFTFRTMSAAIGSIAILGIFVLLLPHIIRWFAEYQTLLSQYLNGEVYSWLLTGALPGVFVVAILAAMLAVLWPSE